MCLLTIAESWLIPKHLGENDKKKFSFHYSAKQIVPSSG